MIDILFQKLNDMGMQNTDFKTIILVGSYARNTQKQDSDIDVVLITARQDILLSDTSWVHAFGTVLSIEKEYYGLVTSLRVFYREFEIEFGISSPEWIKIPLDHGTRRVLSDGYRILYENENCLEQIKLIIPPLINS